MAGFEKNSSHFFIILIISMSCLEDFAPEDRDSDDGFFDSIDVSDESDTTISAVGSGLSSIVTSSACLS